MAADLMRPAQAAEALNVSLRTVYRLIASGVLEARRFSPHGTRVESESVYELRLNGLPVPARDDVAA